MFHEFMNHEVARCILLATERFEDSAPDYFKRLFDRGGLPRGLQTVDDSPKVSQGLRSRGPAHLMLVFKRRFATRHVSNYV
ncbi:hypothetical protein A0130_06170 [Leifsonia xyli]|nr:hypothetical protein A0130_06170 [Leifsonia xyli]